MFCTGEDDPIEVWARGNTRDALSQALTSWRHTYEYRWVNGRIFHPLPLEETRQRHAITLRAYSFLAEQHRRHQSMGEPGAG